MPRPQFPRNTYFDAEFRCYVFHMASKKARKSQHRNEPTRDEKLAARVVTSFLKCGAQFKDTGAKNNELDWELRFSNGDNVGLEVSSVTDPELHRLAGAIGANSLSVLEGTVYSWHIGIRSRTDVKKLRDACPKIFAVLEAQDTLTIHEAESAIGQARDAARELVDIGAVIFAAYECVTGRPELRLYPAWEWRTFDAGKDLNHAVEEQANANNGKFLRRGEFGGHLFLWATI
jgi:hypothetical protein